MAFIGDYAFLSTGIINDKVGKTEGREICESLLERGVAGAHCVGSGGPPAATHGLTNVCRRSAQSGLIAEIGQP